ncbi:MAG: hypothetical protein CME60_05375 [Halobacteriovoraceae bacterium]|nr:hypothetical protein [Halobacteriovoraceae bacterium]
MYRKASDDFSPTAFTTPIAGQLANLNLKRKKDNRIFIAFLLISLVVHLLVLFYQNQKSITLRAAPISQAPLSLKINMRKPVIIPQKKPLPKVVKKNPFKKREKIKKEELVKKPVKKEVAEQPVPTTPQTTTKAFDSVIANYVQPHYPRMAIRRGLTGIVTLTLWIKDNGQVDRVELTKSSGHKSLDHSALEAVKRWQFKNLMASHGHEQSQIYKVEKRIVYKIN